MPYNSAARGPSVPKVALDTFADSLSAPKAGAADADGPQLVCWAQHERVFLLRFPDRGAQTAALGRLSLFLEDVHTRGTVSQALPTGKSAGVAAYSGHNFRSTDAAVFFNAVRDTNVALSPAEDALRTLLLAHRLLLTVPDGSFAGAPGLCIITIARGLPRAEAMSTLLHECMHGLFYTSPDFVAAVRSFWDNELTASQRDAWRQFLQTMGYDASHEELCINEFQAYMSTERELFGAGGNAAASTGSGASRGKARGAGGAAGELAATLTDIQRAFAAALREHVPQPVPMLPGYSCVFGDGACAPGGGGPFRLRT